TERALFEECPVRRIALEATDLNRASPLVLEHARALAQQLGRADARARAAEEVLREDQLGGTRAVPLRNCADEAGNVYSGRAGERARRAGEPAAVEAAVGLDDGSAVVERRLQLLVQPSARLCNSGHRGQSSPRAQRR